MQVKHKCDKGVKWNRVAAEVTINPKNLLIHLWQQALSNYLT